MVSTHAGTSPVPAPSGQEAAMSRALSRWRAPRGRRRQRETLPGRTSSAWHARPATPPRHSGTAPAKPPDGAFPQAHPRRRFCRAPSAAAAARHVAAVQAKETRHGRLDRTHSLRPVYCRSSCRDHRRGMRGHPPGGDKPHPDRSSNRSRDPGRTLAERCGRSRSAPLR